MMNFGESLLVSSACLLLWVVMVQALGEMSGRVGPNPWLATNVQSWHRAGRFSALVRLGCAVVALLTQCVMLAAIAGATDDGARVVGIVELALAAFWGSPHLAPDARGMTPTGPPRPTARTPSWPSTTGLTSWPRSRRTSSRRCQPRSTPYGNLTSDPEVGTAAGLATSGYDLADRTTAITPAGGRHHDAWPRRPGPGLDPDHGIVDRHVPEPRPHRLSEPGQAVLGLDRSSTAAR